MRCSRHPTIALVRDRTADLEGGTGTIHERQSAEEAEDGQDGAGLSGWGRAALEARGAGDTGRREVPPLAPLPTLPGRRDEDEEEEEEEDEDEDEESLSRRSSLAKAKPGLGPVREAVQQLDAMEAVSQTISALALEGLELSTPSRKYL
jgi:hypothetical protein